MGVEILLNISHDGPLQTLTPSELRLKEVPLTINPRPRCKVKAWVRFGSIPIRVDSLVAR